MSLESVDLLTLLRRARKTVAQGGTATVVEEPPAPKVPENVPVPAAPTKRTAPVVKAAEQEELDLIRAELLGDEVLIQRILGLLYRSKRENPNAGFISILDLERILNVEREGAAFVMSYMKVHKIIEMDDKSRMAITVPGIDYLRKVLAIHAAPIEANEDVVETVQEGEAESVSVTAGEPVPEELPIPN